MTSEGISSQTYVANVPPKHFLSNLHEVLKPTKNCPVENESSIFVSKKQNTSALPLIPSE